MKSIMIYLTIIMIVYLLSYWSYKMNNRRNKYLCIFLLIFIPSLFAALRFNIGTDYAIHEKVFIEISQGLPITKRAEMGYVFLNQLVAMLGGNFNVLLFFITFISTGCMYFAFDYFREKINVPIAMLAYMFLYYQMSFNYIRQILAATIAVLALTVFLKGKKIPAYILVMAAASIHITALIFIPCFILYHFLTSEHFQKYRSISYVILICIVFLYPIFLMPLLEMIQNVFPGLRYFINYLGVDYKPLGFGLFRYILLFIVPGILTYKKMSKDIYYVFQISIYGFILWLTSYVTYMEFYRISYTFLILIPILLGFFWQEESYLGTFFFKDKLAFLMNKSYFEKYALKVMLLGLLIFFWYYDYFYLGAHETVPYISIIGGLL